MGSTTVGRSWSAEELTEALDAAGISVDAGTALVPVKISPADLNPEFVREQITKAQRKTLTIGLPLTIGVVAVLVIIFDSTAGISGAAFMLVLQGIFPLVMQWFERPRIVGPLRPGSQADSFVDALLGATSNVRKVVNRWILAEPAALSVVTQEERWDYQGPHQELEIRWTPKDGAVTGVSEDKTRWRTFTVLTFADESALRIELDRRTRAALTDRQTR